MLACLLSGNPSKIKEFQRQLLSSSWPPGEMAQRNSTVPTLQSGKSLVIRGKSVTFSRLQCPCSTSLPCQQGLTYSAINTARSALSSYITLENGTCVGQHPLVSRLMKGIFQEKPPRPKYTGIWDVSIVLSHLRSLSPVDKLSLKKLTLKLVVLISFWPKRSDCSFVKH